MKKTRPSKVRRDLPAARRRAARVFIPTDFSALADQALAMAPLLLKEGGQVCLAHVSPIVYKDGYRHKNVDVRATASAQRLAQLALACLAGRHGLKAQLKVVAHAKVAQTLAGLAARWRADLLLISSHGRGGLSRLLLGSTAQKVLSRYRGSVLVLRPALDAENG